MKVNNESLSLTSYQLETKVLNVGLCKYIIALGNINKAYLDCIDNTLLAGNIGNYDCTSLCSSLPGSWRWVWSQWVKTMISIIGPRNVSINHLFFPVRDWCFQIVSDQIQTSFWKIGISMLCFISSCRIWSKFWKNVKWMILKDFPALFSLQSKRNIRDRTQMFKKGA